MYDHGEEVLSHLGRKFGIVKNVGALSTAVDSATPFLTFDSALRAKKADAMVRACCSSAILFYFWYYWVFFYNSEPVSHVSPVPRVHPPASGT